MRKQKPEITISTLVVSFPEKRDVRVYAVTLSADLSMIGFAEVAQLEQEFWWITSLYVGTQYRGMGIGAQLLQRVFNDAAKEGRSGVCLAAVPDNNFVLQWYERRGMLRVYEYVDGSIMFHYPLIPKDVA